MGPTISIIVPIYNMEKYLARCLDSILAQSYVDLEIVAVNDGSTDNTLKILEQYAADDARVVIVNRSNGGVSSARNEGIRRARGEYIGFVDPDDWVDKNMFAVMYSAAEREQADVVMCTYIREFGNHSKVKKFTLPEQVIYREAEVQERITRRLIGPLKEELAQPDYLDAWGTIWNKLYRAELIENNAISFVDLEVIGSNEDSLFNIHACYHAKSFVFLNQPLYHYWRVNSSSITSGYNPLLEGKLVKLYNHMEHFIETRNLPSHYQTALNNRISINILGLGLNIINENHQASSLNKIKDIKLLIAGSRSVGSLEAFEIRYCPQAWKIFFMFAKWRFATGIYLMLQTMNRIRYLNTRGAANGTHSNPTGGNHNEPGRAGDNAHELLPANGPE